MPCRHRGTTVLKNDRERDALSAGDDDVGGGDSDQNAGHHRRDGYDRRVFQVLKLVRSMYRRGNAQSTAAIHASAIRNRRRSREKDAYAGRLGRDPWSSQLTTGFIN